MIGIALADTSAAYGALSGHDTNIITIIARYNIINKFELKSKVMRQGIFLTKL
jgi:hypothetical protein